MDAANAAVAVVASSMRGGEATTLFASVVFLSFRQSRKNGGARKRMGRLLDSKGEVNDGNERIQEEDRKEREGANETNEDT